MRSAALLILALLGCSAVTASDLPTSFLTYESLGYIYQQNFVLFQNYTSYVFGISPPTVYVTDLVPFLNASFVDPPAINTVNATQPPQGFSLANTKSGQQSISQYAIGSISYYDSKINSTNSGFYITATQYVFHFDPKTFETLRYTEVSKAYSFSLWYSFVDVETHRLFAFSSPGNILMTFDLEKFNTNTTFNYTLNVAPTMDIYDANSRTAFFFAENGGVDVWDISNTKSLTTFDTSQGVAYPAYTLSTATADFPRSLLYVVASSPTNGSSSSSLVLQVFNITGFSTLNGTLTPLQTIVLNQTPLRVTSIAIEPVGGQAFVGISDGSQGNFLRVDLLRNTVAETVAVAQDANNGKEAVAYRTGIQNQSLVLFSDFAINVFQYPTTCPNDCTGDEYGFCQYGTCVCKPGYTSDDCSQLACDTDCGAGVGHGACNNGQCLCEASWTGPNCATQQCPLACSGNGECSGPLGGYNCTCNFRYNGAGCNVPKTLKCSEIPGAQECTGRKDCGWCHSETKCMPGNNIGPSYYACPDWFTENPKDTGIMAFAIIYIIICCVLIIINIVTALIIDHQNATELVATKRLTATTIRRNWWRDERSNMGWLLFEQLQFISLFGLITVGYSTRILSFTRYFNWTCLVIPLPGYMDTETHFGRSSETSTSRSLADYEQYANGNDSGISQIWYSQMVWLAIALGGATVAHLIYAVIAAVVRGSGSKEVFFSRLIHMWVRMLNIFYFPLVLIAASHTFYGGNTIAGSIIALAVIGLGLPAASFGLTYGKSKQLFRYEWRAKFGAFYSTYHFSKPYFQLVILARKAAAALLIGFMAAPLSRPTLAFGQVFGAIGVMIIFIVVIILSRPYLDKVHMLLEVGLNILNIISIGMALTNYASPSLIGDIIFLLLQILGLLIVLGAFIHCWLAMEKVNCCGPKSEENDGNTSELATMKM